MQLPICGITKPMGTIGTGTLRSSKWGMGMARKQGTLWIQESIMDCSTLREMYLHITNMYHDRCVAIAIFSLFRHFQLWFRSPHIKNCEVGSVLLHSLSFIDHYAKKGQVLLLMEEILHQLRLVVYPISTENFFLHPRWWSPGFWTINSICTFSPTIWTTNDSTLPELRGRRWALRQKIWRGTVGTPFPISIHGVNGRFLW